MRPARQVGGMGGAHELLPGLTRDEVALVLRRFGPAKAGVARGLGVGESTVEALLDPYGRVARKVLERVRARLADGGGA